MWFEKLTGFKEDSSEYVRSNIELSNGIMTSLVNGNSFKYGRLEIPTLEALRNRIPLNSFNDRIRISEIVGNVQALHTDSENEGALFQVASQFNLLEMVSPRITPEEGVGIYEIDKTQGPACAVAAGAGTIFRNYFVEVNEQIGQSSKNQIDCLSDIGFALGNENSQLWSMKNGYAIAEETGLFNITKQLKAKNEIDYERLLGKLRIGIQFDTQVTLDNCKHTVSQAYCSALPVAYSQHSADLWTEFAKLILNATYEATFYAGLINYLNTGNNKIFLTLVGGGVFGNSNDWIISAIRRAVIKFSNTPLDISIVSYRSSKAHVRAFLNSI